MFIRRLEVENWKCFAKKKTFDFSKHELITMKNGTGKSSIFQAIAFAIWGKTPTGFNLNSVRNDPNKLCRVYLDFTLNNGESNATIERVFGTSSPISELRINDELICESIRSIEDYMNNLFDYKITSQLWTASLKESDIISANFFSKVILEDILKDPLFLSGYYKTSILANNKTIAAFDKKELLDVEKIKFDLENIKKNLKEKTDGNVNVAKTAKEASEKINKDLEIIGNSNLTLDKAKEYKRFISSKSDIENKLRIEMEKKDSLFTKFNENEVKKILNESKNMNCCAICRSPLTKTKVEELEKELALIGRSENKITQLKEQLKLLSEDQAIVEAILEYNFLKEVVNKCPNFDEIIKSYDEENTKLWKEFEEIEKNYAIALKQQEELIKIKEIKNQTAEYKIKLEVLKKYIEEANNYYTTKIMEKATQYFISMNSRYKQICLMENIFYVVVEQEDFALNMLPVSCLSDGEKTMCALALLFSIHNIIVPEIPLLFDETFSALDRENLEQVQSFLKLQDTQIFVITHDKNWQEF